MSSLSEGELVALANLVEKNSGAEVEWINIADALALTRLGYAKRTREGWAITSAGSLKLVQSQMKAPDVT